VTTVTNRCFAQVLGRRAQAGCLSRSTLIFQLSDLKLKPRYSTLAAVRPVLKRLLEEFWRTADLDHLRTKQGHSYR
jgi:hypothetical protein